MLAPLVDEQLGLPVLTMSLEWRTCVSRLPDDVVDVLLGLVDLVRLELEVTEKKREELRQLTAQRSFVTQCTQESENVYTSIVLWN